MQVRPIAARDVDMDDFHTPAANVRAGVRYLRRLLSMFPAADPHQQIALALAAYNMGPAHLSDAQILAKRYGLDSRRWYDGIELVLPLLEQPAIYRTLPNGFAQGRSVLRYVEKVLSGYERLRGRFSMTEDRQTQLN
jgi:membrane-bound lytic murein transglycosylase F